LGGFVDELMNVVSLIRLWNLNGEDDGGLWWRIVMKLWWFEVARVIKGGG
jgi:hypothetical protein